MLQIIKKLLLKIVDDIDAGNTNASEEELMQVAKFLRKYNYRDKWLTKYQAFTYLNISRAKFDGLVREGILPRGVKTEGSKELRWSVKTIKEYAKSTKTGINQ